MTTPLTLAQLVTPITRDEALAEILQIGTDVGLPLTSWQEFSVGRELLFVFAQKVSDLSQITALVASGGYLDFASGDWLKLLSKQDFDVDPPQATFGTTTETLTNSSTTTYPIGVGDLRFASTDPRSLGATYQNTTGGTLPAGGTLDVIVKADVSGSGSNAASGTITNLVTTRLGVTCTNALPLVASDELTDDQLRELDRESRARLSPNGPEDAYNFFAKTATLPDGSSAGITRTKTVQGNGTNTVYVASSGGPVTGTFNDITTPLGAAYDNIVRNCRPTGITVNVVSATALAMQVRATIYRLRGSTLSATDAQTAVLARLTNYFANLPIGGFDVGAGGNVFADALISEIFAAEPGLFAQVVLTAPVADTSVLPQQVPTLTSIATDFTISTAI